MLPYALLCCRTQLIAVTADAPLLMLPRSADMPRRAAAAEPCLIAPLFSLMPPRVDDTAPDATITQQRFSPDAHADADAADAAAAFADEAATLCSCCLRDAPRSALSCYITLLRACAMLPLLFAVCRHPCSLFQAAADVRRHAAAISYDADAAFRAIIPLFLHDGRA